MSDKPQNFDDDWMHGAIRHIKRNVDMHAFLDTPGREDGGLDDVRTPSSGDTSMLSRAPTMKWLIEQVAESSTKEDLEWVQAMCIEFLRDLKENER